MKCRMLIGTLCVLTVFQYSSPMASSSDILAKTREYKKRLFECAKAGNLKALAFAHERGIRLNKIRYTNQSFPTLRNASILSYAAWGGQKELIIWLLESYSELRITQLDGAGLSVLHYAALGGHRELIAWLLESYSELSITQLDDHGRNIAHYAVWGGHKELIRWLATYYPVIINQVSIYGRTALDVAEKKNLPYVAAFLRSLRALTGSEVPMHNAFIAQRRSRLRLVEFEIVDNDGIHRETVLAHPGSLQTSSSSTQGTSGSPTPATHKHHRQQNTPSRRTRKRLNPVLISNSIRANRSLSPVSVSREGSSSNLELLYQAATAVLAPESSLPSTVIEPRCTQLVETQEAREEMSGSTETKSESPETSAGIPDIRPATASEATAILGQAARIEDPTIQMDTRSILAQLGVLQFRISHRTI